jgi:hypothetical protein
MEFETFSSGNKLRVRITSQIMNATKPSARLRYVAFAVLAANCALPAAVLPVAYAQAASPGAAVDAKVAALLEHLPSDDGTAAQTIAELSQLRREGSVNVANRLVPFEKGGDARVRFALNGMAMHAGQNAAERTLFTRTLAELLAMPTPTVRDREFLLQQLNVAGGPEAIDAIGSVLLDAQLYERDSLSGTFASGKSYTIPNRTETVQWKAARPNSIGLLSFLPLMGQTDNLLAYATITVQSPSARAAIVSVGSDDSARVWLNGTEIINKNVPRGATRGEDQVPVQLR